LIFNVMACLRSLCVLGLVAVALPLPGAAEPTADLTLAEAVNQAGRQRMLTQRITKAYALAGLLSDSLAISSGTYERQVRDAVRRFETELAALKAYVTDDGARRALARVDDLWPPYREIALASYSHDALQALWQRDEALLAACEDVVRRLQEPSVRGVARYVDVAGRQRMLSQRLAKLYMLRASGLDHPLVDAALEQARNEFRSALATLMEAPENTAALREKLGQVEEQWRWLQGAMDMYREARFPTLVDDASEKTLRLTEDVTDLYQALAGTSRP
jgi:nitrate/nitrite-specific signal transduction histidine kinase